VVTAFVVAIAGLAIFVSAAFASNNGYSGYSSTNSCYNSPVGGIGHANNTPASYRSNSAVIYYYADQYPCYYY
jgi:hypothetical protein